MKRIIRYFQRGWAAWAVLLLLVSACSKEGLDYVPGGRFDYSNTGPAYNDLAIGTLRSREGVRYVRLDASTVGMIVNPDEVKHISDGTRVFLQYRCVVLNTTLPEFCTDAILVEWADPLNVGEIVTEPQDRPGDPMSVILDWMTCLEDGFVATVSVCARGRRRTNSVSSTMRTETTRETCRTDSSALTSPPFSPTQGGKPSRFH